MEESFRENFEDLSAENEIKKIKLSLEHGMDFPKSFSNPELPPELEGMFLDQVQKWEDQYAQRKMISIYDLAERPAFRPISEILPDEVESELNRVLEILHQHSVVLDTLCDVDDSELYRFVTEELMNEETNDIRIEGMMHCFTYEEFYPNHEYDIKNRCTELVHHITDKELDGNTAPWGLAAEIWNDGSLFTKEQLNKKIVNFRDSFNSFEVHDFQYTAVNLDDDKNEAEAKAYIHFTGNIDGLAETVEFKGQCSFSLKCEYEWWTINKFELPCGFAA
jgi:hypothetical protein